jgi:hypothetical protein
MQIRWPVPAAQELERICAWIERDNPDAARRVRPFTGRFGLSELINTEGKAYVDPG